MDLSTMKCDLWQMQREERLKQGVAWKEKLSGLLMPGILKILLHFPKLGNKKG